MPKRNRHATPSDYAKQGFILMNDKTDREWKAGDRFVGGLSDGEDNAKVLALARVQGGQAEPRPRPVAVPGGKPFSFD